MKTASLTCDVCGEDCGYVPPYIQTSIVVQIAERRQNAPWAQFAGVERLFKLLLRGLVHQVNGEQVAYNRVDLCGACTKNLFTEDGRRALTEVLERTALPEPRPTHADLANGVLQKAESTPGTPVPPPIPGT